MPLTLEAFVAVLHQFEEPCTVVDLVFEGEGITAYLVAASGLRVVHVPVDGGALALLEEGDTSERQARLLSSCMPGGFLQSLGERLAMELPQDGRVVVVPIPSSTLCRSTSSTLEASRGAGTRQCRTRPRRRPSASSGGQAGP